MFTLITSCTSTRTMEPLAKVGDLPNNLSMDEALTHWLQLLAIHNHSLTTPRELYRGMGFLTLTNTLQKFGIKEAYIVTGGQGLIHIDEKIVPYDFTADVKTSPNITEKVTKEPFIQTAWWRMICAARGKGENPVAQLINKSNKPSSVVISCPKIFLRYIAQDILSVDPKKANNFRILLSSSSLGSVPVQLRPYIVAFDRSSINHIPGNRNDVTHRAAQMFIDALTHDPTLAEAPPHVQRQTVYVPEGYAFQNIGGFNVRECLSQRKDLLELEPEMAYRILYREKGPIGGRLKFYGMFNELKGDRVTKDADDDALAAFDSLGLTPSTKGGDDGVVRAIELVAVFVAAVKEKMPTAAFKSQDISNWASLYCKSKEEDVPDVVGSPLKLHFFLKTHAPMLGIEVSGKEYRLRS